MKKFVLIGIFSIGLMTDLFSTENLKSRIKFASLEKAKELLTEEDEFTKSWSQFDIDSRMHQQNSTKEELFDFISKQSREWTSKEKSSILSIVESIDNQITQQGFKMDFPDEIYFLKTSTKEEGSAAAYTRSNYIVLKDDLLNGKTSELKSTVVHEIFHVLSRSNPEFRKSMYEIIGFKLMRPIDYPEKLKAYRITNPDAPQTDTYISLKVKGESVDCMMILYSKEEYDGGEFFKYLNMGFLRLTQGEEKNIYYMENNEPVIYSLNEVSGFFEKVGKNTKYIIHPEEIMAVNFSFAILNKSDLPNQEIVNKIKAELRE